MTTTPEGVHGGEVRRPRPALSAVAGAAVQLYGLSRGTQAMLSLAQPALALLLAAGLPPPAGDTALCLAASVTGGFAVFAANDLIDLRLDRRRFAHERSYDAFDIDVAGPRHPLVHGGLRVRTAVGWSAALALVSLALWALLSPVCAALFLAAAALEAVYCLLATVTPYKFLVAGLVVGGGACLGWFAVDERPASGAWATLALFAAWMAAWEIGGRNIVNDWADVEEDVHLGIRTVPVVMGRRAAGRLIALFLGAAAALGVVLMIQAGHGATAVLATAATGVWLLLLPGWRLLRDGRPETALALFNRASCYPPVMLLVTVCAFAAHDWWGV
jgi:4-hydroxybenzoate polyprenyltransferase